MDVVRCPLGLTADGMANASMVGQDVQTCFFTKTPCGVDDVDTILKNP